MPIFGFAFAFGSLGKPTMSVTPICVVVKAPVGAGPSAGPDYQPAG